MTRSSESRVQSFQNSEHPSSETLELRTHNAESGGGCPLPAVGNNGRLFAFVVCRERLLVTGTHPSHLTSHMRNVVHAASRIPHIGDSLLYYFSMDCEKVQKWDVFAFRRGEGEAPMMWVVEGQRSMAIIVHFANDAVIRDL